LREAGYASSVVKAVLAQSAEGAHDPYAARLAAAALSEAVAAPDWAALLNAYARCVRITRPLKETFALRPDDLAVAEERAVLDELLAAEAAKDGSVETFVTSLRHLEPGITRLFEAVMIMDDDPAVRENRLALLQRVAGLAGGVAELAVLEGF
jgi:glycyl-tRNA synthetase beta subunit